MVVTISSAGIPQRNRRGQVDLWTECEAEQQRIAAAGQFPPVATAANVRSVIGAIQEAAVFPDLSQFTVRQSGSGQGRCLDPHPGRFREQSEPVAQCETKVWRYFEDGCSHYPLFNPCGGTWDVYPNGAPHVYWQRCLH